MNSIYTKAIDYNVIFDKKTMRGLDPNLLVIPEDEPDKVDYLICIICYMVVIEPYKCSNCPTLMCKTCFNDWDKINPNSCPKRCGTKIIYTHLDETKLVDFKLYCINSGLINVLTPRSSIRNDDGFSSYRESIRENQLDSFRDSIKFSKPYCTKVLTYDNFFDHIYNCEYTDVKCNYCEKSFTMNKIEKHLDKCNCFLITCIECELSLMRSELEEHNSKKHIESKINCKFCGKELKAKMLDSHLEICDKNTSNNTYEYEGQVGEILATLEDENDLSTAVGLKKEIAKVREKIRLAEFSQQSLLSENKTLKEYKSKWAIIESNFLI